MRLMVTTCKYISVLYVDINKFAIVVVHSGPFLEINNLKKKKKSIDSGQKSHCPPGNHHAIHL